MKFGKEFASQMVLEWQTAYMDYKYLKNLLKDILLHRKINVSKNVELTLNGSVKRKLSLYRAFSGLTNRPKTNKDDEVILVSEVNAEEGSEVSYQTLFLRPSEEGGVYELVFFKKLDGEFNKVLKFYTDKVHEMINEAEELSKQMNALIALRVRMNNPLQELRDVRVENPDPSPASVNGIQDSTTRVDVIQEVEMSSEDDKSSDQEKARDNNSTPNPLEILEHVKMNIKPETPMTTLRNVLSCSTNSSFSKEKLRIAEEKLKQAFIVFYEKLRLLKNFSFLNQLGFSKIMKKYDKITSRNAARSYLDIVEKSYLGSSDEVSRLIERVEAAFIQHFSNGDRSKGMTYLRPHAEKEKHRVTFFLGLFVGCTIALLVAIIVAIQLRNLLESDGRTQYMENKFPLYSFFGYIILHLLMYGGNIYFWRRFRVNYSFIFGFKQGTELTYRKVLLVASGLSLLLLAAVLSNLDMEMDPRTNSYETLIELIPLFLVIVVFLITFCPFNIIYRSSRIFFLQCVWHFLCAPLYKVNFPDFFLADQMTSQVQAIRNALFYICYYGWGDFRKRENKCQESNIYQILFIVVAIIPFWARFLQCVRRLFEEKDAMHMLNGLKYFSTIVALVMRTCYSQKGGSFWRIMAAASSGITTIFNTYWDVVIDWGLLSRDSNNSWLRDKLLVPNKSVYFAAIVINILLRLVWMQLVLDFNETSFLHRRAVIAIVASLEILRRGIWNFFRLENEHLNNVGKYRAVKSVPMPFNYDKSL